MSPRTTFSKSTPSAKGNGPELSVEIAAELAELEAALRGEPGAGDELSALVREVRAAAPQLDGGVSQELDGRVAEQFARPKPGAERGGVRAAGVDDGDGSARSAPLARAPRGLSGAFGGWRGGGAPAGRSWAFGGTAGVMAVTLLAFVGVAGSLVVLQQGVGSENGSGDVIQSLGGDGSSVTERFSGGSPESLTVQSAPSGGGENATKSSGSASADAAMAESGAGAPTGSEQLTARSGASSAAPGAGGSRQRAVRRSVDMVVTVEELDQAAMRVGEITGDAGGFVSTSEVNLREGDTGSGRFTLRIPTAKLDATLRELGELGVVTEQNRSAQDITSQLNSAEAKLADAKEERRALLRALAKANASGEIASLRARIADNRREQARLDAAVRRVQAQTTTSTVQLTLTTYRDGGMIEPDRDGLRGALDDAVAILEGIAGFLIVAAAVIAPFALLGGAAAWAIARRRRARHRRALGGE